MGKGCGVEEIRGSKERDVLSQSLSSRGRDLQDFSTRRDRQSSLVEFADKVAAYFRLHKVDEGVAHVLPRSEIHGEVEKVEGLAEAVLFEQFHKRD